MSIRVATRQVFINAERHGMRAQSRVAEASVQMSTGLRVNTPGDDPASFAEASRHRNAAARLERLGRAAGRGVDQLRRMDQALGGAQEIIMRAKEMAVQFANDTYDAGQRQAAALEVDGLIRSFTAELNVEHGGRYLFGGHQTGAPPFDATGAYNGDAGIRQLEIAPGVTEPVSIRADQAVLGTAGGVDIYQAFQDLQAALNANDSAAVRATLDELDQGLEQLSVARAEIGGHDNVFSAAVSATEHAREAAQGAAANAEEVDIYAASTALAQAETAYQAVGAAMAKAFDLNILDRF